MSQLFVAKIGGVIEVLGIGYLFRCLAFEEVKDLKERITFLQNEKLALEKVKQAEAEELGGQLRSKD